MTDDARKKLVTVLVAQPANSRTYTEALRDADVRTLADAIKECLHRPSGALVNRTRHDRLVDHMVFIVLHPPALEMAAPAKPKKG